MVLEGAEDTVTVEKVSAALEDLTEATDLLENSSAIELDTDRPNKNLQLILI